MKYKNRKIAVDGMTFDSRKEYRRWCVLCVRERAGQITGLKRQTKYELIPAQYRTIETGEVYKRDIPAKCIRAGDPKTKEVCIEKACVYIADFEYYENGRLVVEDVKGVRTEAYKIKRKLCLYRYGIKIREV